jgi:hypothetical protein
MTALTQDRQTPLRAAREFVFPMAAATKIFGGSIVCLNSTGYATKGAVSTTLKAVGIADGAADNSAGANGDVKVKAKRGTYKLGNSASTDLIALADVGNNAYIVDDQTVAKTNGSSTRSIAGVIRDVDADGGVWIEF